MRNSLITRLGGAVATIALLLSFGTSSVLAKEGVSVSLSAPLPGDAAPGTIVAAFFTMEAISDDVASPLRKASVFMRLYGPGGAMTEAAGVEQTTPGLYKAMIEIPTGGIARRLVVRRAPGDRARSARSRPRDGGRRRRERQSRRRRNFGAHQAVDAGANDERRRRPTTRGRRGPRPRCHWRRRAAGRRPAATAEDSGLTDLPPDGTREAHSGSSSLAAGRRGIVGSWPWTTHRIDMAPCGLPAS